MRRHHPYADRSAFVDMTRKLADEEMAELQLELGYVGRALRIYEGLLRGEPRNPSYRARCEWLARIVLAETSPVRHAVPARSATADPGATTPGNGGVAAVVGPPSAAVRSLEIITVGC